MHLKNSDLSTQRCRALGIDFGTKRIGMAVSDSTNTLAAPLKTLTRREGKRPPYACMLETARDYDVCQLVVGLPLSLDGEENEWCTEVRLMGDKIGRKIGADVAYVDERMTSVQAERALHATGLPRSKRREKGRVDAAAAQLILQAWLDNPSIAR
ncbi:MAG TPA: Holliday junction resolvase RuvX [Gemmatimonadetes bacterium]|nr:Holliday junction resolvase RuvX [Gemmatimonadota bacterium]HAT37063.1 Holliday junction resolvase RuvX [Gemmatimonadota bacterium]